MSGRYLGRKVAQAVFTILAIVVLNFLLFRMMPGSPERVLLRNPYLTQEKVAAGPRGVGSRQAALPGPAGRLSPVDRPRVTSATRSTFRGRRSRRSSRSGSGRRSC